LVVEVCVTVVAGSLVGPALFLFIIKNTFKQFFAMWTSIKQMFVQSVCYAQGVFYNALIFVTITGIHFLLSIHLFSLISLQ
jgi:hypothetical protein